jgi:hypothetical protein
MFYKVLFYLHTLGNERKGNKQQSSKLLLLAAKVDKKSDKRAEEKRMLEKIRNFSLFRYNSCRRNSFKREKNQVKLHPPPK